MDIKNSNLIFPEMLPQYAYGESTGAFVMKRPGLGNQDNYFDYKRNHLGRVHNWTQLLEVGTSD